MTTKNFEIPCGATWNPSIAITEDGSAKNCTNLSCRCVIKESEAEEVIAKYSLNISWTNQAGGLGEFTLTNIQSKLLTIGSKYPYQVWLYKSDGTFNKLISEGIILIGPSLDKDIPT